VPYLRKAQIALICFAVDNPDSFNRVPTWIQTVENYAHPVIILVGTKRDLRGKAAVEIPQTTAEESAERGHMQYFETSSTEGTNIQELIDHLGRVAENLPPPVPEQTIEGETTGKEGWCWCSSS
jgi:GTPase SAR1 family protein